MQPAATQSSDRIKARKKWGIKITKMNLLDCCKLSWEPNLKLCSLKWKIAKWKMHSIKESNRILYTLSEGIAIIRIWWRLSNEKSLGFLSNNLVCNLFMAILWFSNSLPSYINKHLSHFNSSLDNEPQSLEHKDSTIKQCEIASIGFIVYYYYKITIFLRC